MLLARLSPFEKFKAHVKKERKQKEKDSDQKDQRPRRLMLDAFSSSVGWRPTGIVPAQSLGANGKYFVCFGSH